MQSDNFNVPLEAIIQIGKGTFDKVYDWSNVFGKLEKGEYRLSIKLNEKEYTVKFIIDN